MTYLKYADLCATHVRNCLKEPKKTKSLQDSAMHVRVTNWEAGKRAKQGNPPPPPPKKKNILNPSPFPLLLLLLNIEPPTRFDQRTLASAAAEIPPRLHPAFRLCLRCPPSPPFLSETSLCSDCNVIILIQPPLFISFCAQKSSRNRYPLQPEFLSPLLVPSPTSMNGGACFIDYPRNNESLTHLNTISLLRYD